MADNSKIEWCRHTANLWWGCQKVHAGCDHCYAETLSHRWGNDIWGPKAPRRAIKAVWKDLARYQREAAAAGEIHRVFVGSMMDIFEKPFPLIDAEVNPLQGTTDDLRQRFFTEVVPNSPNLLFLLLTKRPGNILKYIPESWKTNPPVNVMYGTSVVNQETADEMIPKLLQVPGRHFLSMEPLLGPVDLRNVKDREYHLDVLNRVYGPKDHAYKQPFSFGLSTYGAIDWVIVGGESGNGARPMHPDWARSLRNQCQAASVPFFFKQWGEWAPFTQAREACRAAPRGVKQTYFGAVVVVNPVGMPVTSTTPGITPESIYCIGKHEAGRLLDGVTHNGYPPDRA